MQRRDEGHVDELKRWRYGSSVLLVSREGRVWHANTGKGGALARGRELTRVLLRDAEQDAKRDPQLRRPTASPDRVGEGGRRVVSYGSPLPLVFEEDGRWLVRFVQPMPSAPTESNTPCRKVFDPIPLHSDRSTGWVKLRDDGEGLVVLHAPSLAAQLFGISAQAD
jgi:hypothetical protein